MEFRGMLERFLDYVKIDTQSDESSETFPSTQKQFEVRIVMKDKVLLATARIKRMVAMGKELNGIGVELAYPISFDT